MKKAALFLLFLLSSPVIAQDISNPQTNASGLSAGTLAAARGGAGTINGALKGNGSGVTSQAACADLSNAATGCSGTAAQALAYLPIPKIITITRDITAATGSVAYTGCGFAPRLLMATGGVNAVNNYTLFFGMAATGGGSGSTALYGATGTTSGGVVSGNFIQINDATAANFQALTVTSYDSDGFTGTWTKGGAPPAGTATFYIACVR